MNETREAREERALKPRYFRKWLAEAGLPANVVAAILEQDEALAIIGAAVVAFLVAVILLGG